MNKKIASILVGVVTLLIFCGYKLLALFGTLIAFKAYNPTQGVWRAPFVGLKHFSDLFSAPFMMNAFSNTFILGISSLILTCVLAYILITAISKFPSYQMKIWAIVILAIPFFIPVTTYVNVILTLFGPGITTNPQLARLLYIFSNVFGDLWIPVAVGIGATIYKKDNSTGFILKLTACITLFNLAFVTNPALDVLLLTYNPTTYNVLDTVGTFIYRCGLLNMDFSSAAAAGFVGSVLQIITAAAGFVGLYAICKKEPNREFKESYSNPGSNAVSLVIYAIIAIIPLTILGSVIFGAFGGDFGMIFANPTIFRAIFNSLATGIFTAIICTATTAILAYPLFHSKRTYLIILLIFMLIPTNIIGEYLTLRNLGMSNTIFPKILTNSVNIPAAIVLYFIVSHKFENGKIPTISEYLTNCWYPLIFVAVITFSTVYGGYLQDMLYISQRDLFGVGMIGRDLSSNAAMIQPKAPVPNVVPAYNFVVSVIPLTFGTLAITMGGRLSAKSAKA